MSQILNQLSILDDYLDSVGMPGLWSILWAILIFLAGRWLAKRARLWFSQAVVRLGFAINESLIRLTRNVIYYGILLIAAILSLAVLGIPIDSLLIILAAIAIFFAIIFQPSLSNMGATIIFVAFQMFKQGDWVELAGTFGQVKEMQMFSTEVITLDMRTVIIPNSEILRQEITNYSEMGTRCVDLPVTITYQGDIQKAKEILETIAKNDRRILTDPAPVIGTWELGDKGVDFRVWLYVEVRDYTQVKLDATEQVKIQLDEADIKIPVPQQDVHLINENE